jgi:hypothetical protein
MNLTYAVDNDSFVVNIYSSDNPVPIIFQPNWPNGTAWGSYVDAENWAQLCILSITDTDAPYAPSGPGLAGEPKNNTI